jgi:excisionase family DNA binding protein
MGISRATAYELVHKPDFPAFRSGRLIRISREAFFEWMARNRIGEPIRKDEE